MRWSQKRAKVAAVHAHPSRGAFADNHSLMDSSDSQSIDEPTARRIQRSIESIVGKRPTPLQVRSSHFYFYFRIIYKCSYVVYLIRTFLTAHLQKATYYFNFATQFYKAGDIKSAISYVKDYIGVKFTDAKVWMLRLIASGTFAH